MDKANNEVMVIDDDGDRKMAPTSSSTQQQKDLKIGKFIYVFQLLL